MKTAKCKLCDATREVGNRQPNTFVCLNCIRMTCPRCGDNAYWLETKQHPQGRYCCFRVTPWCDWTSDTNQPAKASA
jgi:hypothetical protein